MTLKTSKSPKAFQKNIKKLKKESYPEKQAVAIAYKKADEAIKRDKKARKKRLAKKK